ncbi:MAG: endonuclease/exonuclease/phosphatase family protein [Bacteroidota bacterium]
MITPILSLGLFVSSLIAAGNPTVTPPCLKIMTFNIRFGTAQDGDNRWAFRRDLLLGVIRDYSPDVLGLQEALRFQIDEILETFPEYEMLGDGRDDGKTKGEYSPLLFRRSKLSPDSHATFWFSDTPDLPGSKTWGNNFPRICTWAVFREQTSDRLVAVYNVHLDHESQPSRERSTNLLLHTIKRTGSDIPVVAMGDFNAGEQNPAVLVLKESLRDSYRELHPKDTVVGTFHAFRGTTTGEKIDHIFVNFGFDISEASIIRAAENGRYPSDHFPVAATICFRERP